ncbi:Signal recognition particle 19 kDa [Musa troglodytarum]|uniref:Signal recognition particle 19 kDa protein n=1 Tax=Musa troglodytarum TaxID=320322 RepID=A0A9E7KPJ6_9LILI|nr:Signal recognition particle 19 kDa [Musa troglodytarum]
MQIDPANIKKWNVIYPVYINSKKTVAEGRRISATKACENPTCIEIGDCCSYLKIPFAIELDKAYPRDFMQRGRVRVQLKREDGSLWNSEIDSSKDLDIHSLLHSYKNVIVLARKATDAEDCRVNPEAPWKDQEAGARQHFDCSRTFKIRKGRKKEKGMMQANRRYIVSQRLFHNL